MISLDMARAPPTTPVSTTQCIAGSPQVARLQAITAELLSLGAGEDYCKDYFRLCMGECKETYGGICMCHVSETPPLPANVVCEIKFNTHFDFLVKRIAFVEEERRNLKQQWADLKKKQLPVENMLSDNAEGQERAKQRKLFLGSQIAHKLGELRGLEHEMLVHLNSPVRRVNAKKFHERVTELLHEKMDVLGELLMGRRVRARTNEPAPPSESDGA